MGRSTVARAALDTGHDYDVEAGPAARPAARRTVTVGAAHDPAEHEADAMAARALAVSRDWAGGEQHRADDGHADCGVHRAGTPEAAGSFDIPAEALQSGSPGKALPEGVRSSMEAGFGADLSHVRVHDGPESAQLSRSISARAFTHGSDIHFGAGEFRPGSADGDKVLAHELAHVVQSGSAARRAPVRRFPATALAGPSVWQPFTGSVIRPGEGLSGGVYILTAKDQNAPIKKVVVKPVFGENAAGTMETGEQMVFGDKALAQWFGIATPVSRSIPAGSSEFSDLVTLCQTKQPPRPTEGGEGWLPVSAAASLLVMSEVPEGRSISGLADKAGTDATASNELYRTVFSDSVLADLGRLQVGDLLLGNSDRMVANAMNLGNVMVSMSGPSPKVYAIDTNALFDRPDAKKVVADGSASSSLQDGWATTAEHIKKDPGRYLDGFFQVVVEKIRAGAAASTTPNAGNTISPADLIETTYQAHRDQFVASFEYGWQDGLIQVFALVNTQEGKAKVKSLTAGVSDDGKKGGLQTAGLKTNAAMLAGLAEGKSGKEASADAAAYAARKYLQSFQLSQLLVPTDEFFWNTARYSADAASADVSDVAPIIPAADLARAFGKAPAGFQDYDRSVFDTVAAGASRLKTEGDALGSKTRGVFKKTVTPRNRTLAKAFIAEAHAMGVGAARAAAVGGRALDALDNVQLAMTGGDKKGTAPAAMPVAQSANAVLTMMPDTMKHYASSLKQAAASLPKIKKFSGRADVAAALLKLAQQADGAATSLTKATQAKKPAALLATLKSG